MGKVKVPYLTNRRRADGTSRWFFQPPSRFLKEGWAAVGLHDKYGLPTADELEAGAACRACGEVFRN
jgi:hypothetical protein